MPKIGKSDSDVVDRFIPPPLLLDESGREVDVFGNIVKKKKNMVATTMINKKLQQREKVLNLNEATPMETDPTKNPLFDPTLKLPKFKRQKREFHFVEAGTFVKKSQRIRAKAVQNQVLSSEILKPEEKETTDTVETVTATGAVKEKKYEILYLK